MKFKEYYNCKFPNLIQASAVTIGNRIYYSFDELEVPRNIRIHERKHVKQYEKYGIFGFLYRYFRDYLKGRFKGESHWEAYYKIPFEIEAFESEKGSV